MKIGANAECPCGSMLKYKKCCRDRVDWAVLREQPVPAVVPYLTVRGRNLLFIRMVMAALQLDSPTKIRGIKDIKRAFTPSAIQAIYEAVEVVWPSTEDLVTALLKEQNSISGLYVGSYEPELIVKGVTRHSLYSDRILLVDPLLYPSTIRPNYRPTLHPAMYRTSTMRWVMLWLQFYPWIKAGMVAFIKTPGDLNVRISADARAITKKRYEDHPELEPRKEEMEPLFQVQKKRLTYDLLLGMPDEHARESYRSFKREAAPEEVEDFIKELHRRRDADPFFVETMDKKAEGEIVHMTSGTNYEMAKITASITGSFIMTDIPSRWREIALDRTETKVDPQRWSPFAKAFDGLPFKYLDSVPLSAALELRKEGRLERLRAFLRRAWGASAAGDEFDDAKITQLAAELTHEVGEAQAEWSTIDRDLVKYAGNELAGGLLAAGPAIALGQAEWLGFALAAGGITNLAVSTMRRSAHERRYPAAFFAKLEAGAYG